MACTLRHLPHESEKEHNMILNHHETATLFIPGGSCRFLVGPCLVAACPHIDGCLQWESASNEIHNMTKIIRSESSFGGCVFVWQSMLEIRSRTRNTPYLNTLSMVENSLEAGTYQKAAGAARNAQTGRSIVVQYYVMFLF